MSSDEKALLEEELKLLAHSIQMLEYSYKKCNEMVLEKDLQLEEMDALEALSARFARTSDILIQKIFRLIDRLELEFDGSAIDRINRAEKRGIISDAAKIKEIRQLRNEIAHEYKQEDLLEMYGVVLRLTPLLVEAADNANRYGEGLIKNNK